MAAMDKNTYYAVLAGCCASSGSLFGKLAGLPSFEDNFILRITFFVLMILCNGCVWTLFVKALQTANSSLVATVTSTATNYILSALIGSFIFREVTSLLWWSGIGLVITGLLLILTDQVKKNDDLLTEAKQK